MRLKDVFIRFTTSSLVLSSFILLTQTTPMQEPVTPTIAPSKTPVTITTETANPQIQEDPPVETEQLELSTQTDLQILTGNIQRPNGMVWANGKLYVSCTGDWTLYEIDPTTGTTSQYLYGVRNAHSFHAETVDNQTEFWVPDFQSNNLVHIFQGRSEIVSPNLSGPWGITKIGADNFLVTNLSANNIVAITSTGETKEVISNLRSPAGLATDQTNIYVANTGSTRRSIEWYIADEVASADEPIQSDEIETQSLVTGLQNTTNLSIGPDNLLYFSYALGTRGVIGRVDPEVCIANGGCTGNEVDIVLYTELVAPLAGLTISPDMKLYTHTVFSPDLYWLQLENETTTPE